MIKIKSGNLFSLEIDVQRIEAYQEGVIDVRDEGSDGMDDNLKYLMEIENQG